jgi:hypothetical protein
MSTYDEHREHLIVQYTEPVKSARPTTHDQLTLRHTSEAPRNRRGDTQIFKGEEYIYDGDEWKLLDDIESESEVPDHQFVGECVIELIKNDAPIDDIREHSQRAASYALDELGRE